MSMTPERRAYLCKRLAEAFMEENPEEYHGETIMEVAEQLQATSDQFLEFSYATYYPGEKLQ